MSSSRSGSPRAFYEGGATLGVARAPTERNAMAALREAHKGGLLAILLAGPFMAQADATIANVATPSIHADLGASGAALELVIGGYLIAFAVLLITGARLGQTHGYRRIFLLGVGVFSLASLLCGLAPSPIVLVLARVVQGAGAALMFPQTLTGIQLNFSGRRRARAIGLYAVALSCGAVVGQILGGALISADVAGTQWRAIFLINIPVGATVIVAALRHLPADDQRTMRRIDLPGVATLSATILLLVLPLVLGQGAGMARLDLDLARRERARLRALSRHRATRSRQRRLAAGQRAGHRSTRCLLGVADAPGRDRHVLRAAVHARPIPPAGPRTGPVRLRPDAGSVGRGVRPRRPGRPETSDPRRAARARRRMPAARRVLHGDQRDALQRPSRGSAAGRAPRSRRPRPGYPLHRPDRIREQRGARRVRARHQRGQHDGNPGRRSDRRRRSRHPVLQPGLPARRRARDARLRGHDSRVRRRRAPGCRHRLPSHSPADAESRALRRG